MNDPNHPASIEVRSDQLEADGWRTASPLPFAGFNVRRLREAVDVAPDHPGQIVCGRCLSLQFAELVFWKEERARALLYCIFCGAVAMDSEPPQEA